MLEQFLYESRPFAFLFAALTSIAKAPNTSTYFFAGLLMFCMAMVLYWRYENRYKIQHPPRRSK